ncbi:MAG: hypothetical protein J6C64_07500 [Lachnospiraceae bacterium]|nr:hypothetical protein [Lachnospiraceae bacterium]
MKIYISTKAAGRRRSLPAHILYEIPEGITTLRDLLTALVRIEVEQYNEKGKDVQIVPFLTAEEITEQAQAGRVSFGRIYSEKKADFVKAAGNALQCYEDGLVRVFQNEEELKQLDAPVQIREGDCFTLIRLTFLAGRLW